MIGYRQIGRLDWHSQINRQTARIRKEENKEERWQEEVKKLESMSRKQRAKTEEMESKHRKRKV